MGFVAFLSQSRPDGPDVHSAGFEEEFYQHTPLHRVYCFERVGEDCLLVHFLQVRTRLKIQILRQTFRCQTALSFVELLLLLLEHLLEGRSLFVL